MQTQSKLASIYLSKHTYRADPERRYHFCSDDETHHAHFGVSGKMMDEGALLFHHVASDCMPDPLSEAIGDSMSLNLPNGVCEVGW